MSETDYNARLYEKMKAEQDSSPAHSQTNRDRISDGGAKRIFRRNIFRLPFQRRYAFLISEYHDSTRFATMRGFCVNRGGG